MDIQDDLQRMMLSSRAYFASCLDMDGINGIRWWLPRKEFEEFLAEEAIDNCQNTANDE
jgi:hypothetical protein